MGGYISSFQSKGRIVLPDGTVHVLEEPITVAELMLEHPQNVIIESNSSLSTKLYSLSADHVLDPKKDYLMVSRGGSSGLSVAEARCLLLTTQRVNIPVFGACILGTGEEDKSVVVSERLRQKKQLKMEEFEVDSEIMCRQYSSKGWKPSLGTIEERNFEKKVKHWLY